MGGLQNGAIPTREGAARSEAGLGGLEARRYEEEARKGGWETSAGINSPSGTHRRLTTGGEGNLRQ